ncbi:hypothetical protein ANN_11542, partial [Periplaneta americana]
IYAKMDVINIYMLCHYICAGGGSAGCHTLYQLTKRGVKAVLLDRAKVSSGTTWHTAGCIWRLRPNDIDTFLLNGTREVLMTLEAETGLDPGWLMNGGIFIAYNEERMNEYRRLSTIGQSFGVESHILDPAETQKLFPLINPEAIIGGLYSPGDGVVDPAMLCAALTKGATNAGGKVIENCPVTDILKKKNDFGTEEVAGVVTPHGTIKTNCIVNCGGVWSREIAAMAGLTLPLVPMKHAYIVSESMPEIRGLPNVRDHDGSIYFRIQGESICMGGYEYNPILLDKVPADFEFSLYELDWSVFSFSMQAAIKLMPKYETLGVKTTVCGPESFTPDHKPLLGEDPRLRGMFQNCGYNSSGMMLGGGCGIQIAQWIVNGRPDLHMFSYDIRRYEPEQTRHSDWITSRSQESYARNYYIVFPNDERLAGRNFQLSPFHEELVAAGCIFQERQGKERPGWFSSEGAAPVPKYDWYGAYGHSPNKDHRYEMQLKKDHTFDFTKNHAAIGEECLACREEVAVFDMSSLGKFYLSGADAQKAADWLFTADTNRPFGRTVYTCALNSRGGVEADVTVTAIETGTGGQIDPIFKGRGFYINTAGGSSYHTWAHIKSVLNEKNFNVDFNDVSENVGVLSIQGPNSRALLQPLLDVDLSDEAFPYTTTKLVKLAGHLCRSVRISFVGEMGWELHIPRDSCLPVYKEIWKQGKKHGLRHAGYRALDSLSSEKGYHLWHFDLQICDNPLEAGLSFSCRKNGEYLGKAALDVVRQKGLSKRLLYFQLKDKIPVWGFEAILRDDKVVGYLRRGEYAYGLGCSIGQGYVKHSEGHRITSDYLQSGEYQIEVMGKRYETTIHLKSPFDPKGKRLLGIYDEPLPSRQ